MNRLQKYVLDRLERSRQFGWVVEAALEANNFGVARLPGSALSLFASALARSTRRPVCLVTSDNDRAREIYDDLEFFGVPNAFFHPEDETLPYEFEEPTVEILGDQIELYMHLTGSSGRVADGPEVIIVPLEAMLAKTIPGNFFKDHVVYIDSSRPLNIEQLARKLHHGGYVRMPVVETRGEFAIRGGIIDIFPLDSTRPIRLDLFGDRIESIRYFDPATQRSLKEGPGERVALAPAKKYLLLKRALEKGLALSPLHSLMPAETIYLLDEPEKFDSRAEQFRSMVERQYRERQKSGEQAVAPDQLYLSLRDVEREIRSRSPVIEHRLLDAGGEARGTNPGVSFHAGTFDGLRPHFETFLGVIKDGLAKDWLVVVGCDNDGQVQRFEELLHEHYIECIAIRSTDRDARAFSPADGATGRVVLVVGPLHSGFVLPEAGLLFLTDREVFGRYRRRHIYRKLYRGTPVTSVAEIQRGDYVVHVDHGIGQFLGLRRQKIDGRETDLIEILYQDGDRLLVPIEKIDKVQKYSAVEGAVPALDKLGGKRWLQRKRKSQEAIEKMAKELLELYARRATVRGYAYGPDTVWQSEFEASFLYKETADQTRAIAEVKSDMERPVPMDRLVCGDVGYGKTEVAMRAAFKAVQERKQVAVLVPTTILAQQHFITFSERFADYDFRIEMLSRFKSKREQRDILRRLRLGEVDIVIGTHRLLSNDVEFADLGLVIIDEEHRFGVRHKEKLKQVRTSVDVLTLTATPIPRTLHMALSGLRDMSVINTPPADRLPIRTSLIHFEKDLIREAIVRELNRGGQVFFVHHRVHDIERVADRLREIVPHGSIAVAHGQMDERDLERVMLDFVSGKYDILLSTTIIESGLDIPNVNTIIINRADAFGLAQQYQLRGRVGRSARQAYAYLIVPQGEPITDAAVRRLAAIQEFVELGSGFQIAMRDMEIRGTGNILGREQHGAMVAVGFELYCQLLRETVQRLKGEAVEAEVATEIKWAIDAYIPPDYVSLEAHRLGLYKRLAQVRSLRAVADIEEEIRDRYGRLPEPVQALIELSALRVAASRCSVARVVEVQRGARLETAGDARNLLRRFDSVRDRLAALGGVAFAGDGAIEVKVAASGRGKLAKLRQVASVMRALAEADR